MRKTKHATAAFTRGANPLTMEQAGELASWIEDDINGYEHPQAIARLLLLCYAFTYEMDTTAREEMRQAVECKLALFLPGFGGMVEGDMRRALAGLKKGGA